MGHIGYAKTEGGRPKQVNYYFDEQGKERFEQQSLDETQFREFKPSEEEFRVARQIRDEVERAGGLLRFHYEGRLLIVDLR